MSNPFLFEAEGFGYESQFEDSYESFEDEYEDEYEGEYEDETRRRGGRRSSGRTSSGGSRSQSSKGRSRNQPSKGSSRKTPSPRPRKPKRQAPASQSSSRFDSTLGIPPPVDGYERLVGLIQRLLNRVLGLNLPVDGLMNVETRSAIRSFLNQKEPPANGTAEPASFDAGAGQPGDADPQEEYDEFEFYDDEADYFEFEEEVNRQSTEYAKWIQRSLNKIIGSRLVVDGIIGTLSRSAIRSFQQKQGLTADGIVGPITEGALIRAGAGSPPQSGGGTSPKPYPIGGSTPSGGPVSGGRVTSPFGYRIHPISRERTLHQGIDIGGLPIGTRVNSTGKGQVISAYLSESAGNMVVVDHGNGYLTKYFHLNSYSVSKGQTVSKGQKIGELGQTGRVTGPHLHYEVHRDGVAVDPAPFINR